MLVLFLGERSVSAQQLLFANTQNLPIQATAITQVFGDGAKFIAVAIEFTHTLTTKQLDTMHFSVKNRTITDTFYTVFVKESVFREGDSREGASGHRNTWRWAYSIEPIREWLFAQKK